MLGVTCENNCTTPLGWPIPSASPPGARSTSTIAVVIFTVFLGIAYLGVRRKEPEKAETFANLIGSIHAIIMRVVTFIFEIVEIAYL